MPATAMAFTPLAVELQPFQEAFQVDDEAFVDAFADLFLLVVGFYLEDEAAAIDLGEPGYGSHPLAERRGSQVFDVDQRADCDIAFG